MNDAIALEMEALQDDTHVLTSLSKQQRRTKGRQKPHKQRKAQRQAEADAADEEWEREIERLDYHFNKAMGEYYRRLRCHESCDPCKACKPSYF